MENYIQIVISRYNENLEWINEFPFNKFTYIVYNKGINDNFEKKNVTKIINLPNIGRCDHTYLYHIVNNYNNLNVINVFLPGSLNIEHKKTNAKKLLNNILKYRTAIFLGTLSGDIQKEFNDFTLDNWCCTDLANKQINDETKLLPAIIRPYGKWFKYHFGNIKVKYYCINGIFSIHKMDILKHKKIRYIKLLRAVERHSNPEVGHYIERSWAALFHPLLFTKVIQ
jgi:Protein of unknown function (DUF3431)